MQDIECRVLVPIHHQSTLWAGMGARAQCLRDQLTTVGTHLGCIAGVYQNDGSASFCRFADGHTGELSPRYIHDAFPHSTALSHVLWCEIFKNDYLILVHQLAAALVREIRTSICDPLMNPLQDRLLLPVLTPILSMLNSIFALLNAL